METTDARCLRGLARNLRIRLTLLGLRSGIRGRPAVDFELNDDQQALKDGVRRFCEGRVTLDDAAVGSEEGRRWGDLMAGHAAIANRHTCIQVHGGMGSRRD